MLVGKHLGPFHIEAELGSGAMGSVYRGQHRDTGRRFAIKMIAYGLLGNETAVKRFEREADILKQLKHPNIVRFSGTGSYKRTPFIIMEYVEGESLDKLLARRETFRWEQVVQLGKQLCAALKHAHDKGIVHRDLKPSNLMILPDGTLKLTDFGIAKDAELTALTAANCTVGTAAYMSPEQCKGEKLLSAKSDLYSMGVVFYELLTGRKPFQAESPIAMFEAHVYSTFERPSRFVMDIPVWLDTLVCQLLEKKPEHRPFDAAMVAKVLDEVEQKVADQRSAGVDAATARGTDRGAKRPADETDRDAARTLRSAVAKKKVRRKTRPLAERKWIQAVLLVAALGGLGGLVFAFTRPPSADKLFDAVRAAFDAKDSEKALAAADQYLRRYGAQDDDRTNQVRTWERSVWVEQCETRLHKRIYGKLNRTPEGDVEKAAFKAIELEDAGDDLGAAEKWQTVKAKAEEAGESDQAVYGLLAQKKLNDLAALPKREEMLADALDYEHDFFQTGPRPDLGSVGQECLEADRFETFGDLFAAREHWKTVRDTHLKSLDDRGWVVFAAMRYRKLEPRTAAGADNAKELRLKLVDAKLADAERVVAADDATNRRRALSNCRDIVALYGADADPQMKAAVAKAKRLLAVRNWARREK